MKGQFSSGGYDYVIVTHIPAFYKVNLYNEIAKNLKILVVFVGRNTVNARSSDFASLHNANFEFTVLNDIEFELRSVLSSIVALSSLLNKIRFNKVIVSGWDLPEFWFVVFSNYKRKNCLALESSINDSGLHGIKFTIKKLFLSRLGKIFCSGSAHKELIDKLGYSGGSTITKGVGIINKPEVNKLDKKYEKRFLYLGRVSKEKNLEFLVDVFNSLPEFHLSIVGNGKEKFFLESISADNIKYYNPVNNSNIHIVFSQTDFLILPSTSEPWGLVVEEALYYGVPVIVSKKCGASELIVNGVNGYIFDPTKKDELIRILKNISDSKFQDMVRLCDIKYINSKDKDQVSSYA